jgi:hypothetical protein
MRGKGISRGMYMRRRCIPFRGYFEIPGLLGHIDTGSGDGVYRLEASYADPQPDHG